MWLGSRGVVDIAGDKVKNKEGQRFRSINVWGMLTHRVRYLPASLVHDYLVGRTVVAVCLDLIPDIGDDPQTILRRQSFTIITDLSRFVKHTWAPHGDGRTRHSAGSNHTAAPTRTKTSRGNRSGYAGKKQAARRGTAQRDDGNRTGSADRRQICRTERTKRKPPQATRVADLTVVAARRQ